jgi:membrane protein
VNPTSILQRLRSAITDPIEELSKWERIVVYVWRLVEKGARQLSDDRASMMAASLTYRTLFGLLPVIVVGAGVARTIMGVERFEQLLQDGISATGLDQVSIGGLRENDVVSLGQWVSDIVASGMSINIAAMTWVGLLVLVYSAIALLVNVETCFNGICRAKKGRTWVRRVPFYLFVLTFGPILFAAAVWIDTQAGSLFEWSIPWGWLLVMISAMWNLLMAWALLLLVYCFVPNISLRVHSAMIGAFVAAILLLIGKESLGLYFSHAVSLHQLYGSIGLVPIFMFWVYLMWLIILLGLQVAAIVEQVSANTVVTQAR